MLRKNLSPLLGLLLSLIISSCASVPDKPVCVELDISRGWCTNTISDVEFFVEDNQDNPFKKSWFEMRPSMVMVPADSWAAYKAYIIKQCKKNNRCNGAGQWEKRAKSIDSKLNAR